MGERGGWNYSDLIYNLEKGDKKGLIKIPHERCFSKFINKFEWFIAFEVVKSLSLRRLATANDNENDGEDEEEWSKKSFLNMFL